MSSNSGIVIGAGISLNIFSFPAVNSRMAFYERIIHKFFVLYNRTYMDVQVQNKSRREDQFYTLYLHYVLQENYQVHLLVLVHTHVQ